jgi:hypothetical protein
MGKLVGSRSSLFELLAILYILLEPVLIMYGWVNFNIASVLSYFLVLVYIYSSIRNKRNLFRSLPKFLSIYFVWLILCNYLSWGSLVPVGNIFIWLLFTTLFSTISFERLIRTYKIVAVLAISLFAVQEVSYYATGYRISGIIQWLPLSYANQDIDVERYLSTRELINRSASFFSEPAHFAQFLFPILAISLLKADSLKSFIFPIIVIIVLLLLQSGNALIGLMCIGFVYTLKILRNRNFIYKSFMVIVLATGCLVGGYYYLNSSLGENLIDRKDSVSGDMDNSSGFFRIYRGYYVFDAYTPIEKVIGLNNFEKIKKRRDESKVSFLVESENDLYFNCFQHFLLRTGYIGALLYILLCFSLWRKNSYEGKAIILTFFALSFVASLYMSSIMMLYVFMSYKYKQSNMCKLNSSLCLN